VSRSSGKWQEARQARHERRRAAGVEPQPRNERGMIIKHVDGHVALAFCCRNCTNTAIDPDDYKTKSRSKPKKRGNR
jgi:hypothetical protein